MCNLCVCLCVVISLRTRVICAQELFLLAVYLSKKKKEKASKEVAKFAFVWKSESFRKKREKKKSRYSRCRRFLPRCSLPLVLVPAVVAVRSAPASSAEAHSGITTHISHFHAEGFCFFSNCNDLSCRREMDICSALPVCQSSLSHFFNEGEGGEKKKCEKLETVVVLIWSRTPAARAPSFCIALIYSFAWSSYKEIYTVGKSGSVKPSTRPWNLWTSNTSSLIPTALFLLFNSAITVWLCSCDSIIQPSWI